MKMKTMAEIKEGIVRTKKINGIGFRKATDVVLGFDDQGRCIYRYLIDDYKDGQSKASEYDDRGRVIHTITCKIRSTEVVEEVIEYDEKNNVTRYTEIYLNGPTISYVYEYNNFNKVVLKKEFVDNILRTTHEYEYYEDGKVKVHKIFSETGAIIEEREYYDKYSICRGRINDKYYIDGVLSYARINGVERWYNECGGYGCRNSKFANILLFGGITMKEIDRINSIIGIS